MVTPLLQPRPAPRRPLQLRVRTLAGPSRRHRTPALLQPSATKRQPPPLRHHTLTCPPHAAAPTSHHAQPPPSSHPSSSRPPPPPLSPQRPSPPHSRRPLLYRPPTPSRPPTGPSWRERSGRRSLPPALVEPPPTPARTSLRWHSPARPQQRRPRPLVPQVLPLAPPPPRHGRHPPTPQLQFAPRSGTLRSRVAPPTASPPLGWCGAVHPLREVLASGGRPAYGAAQRDGAARRYRRRLRRQGRPRSRPARFGPLPRRAALGRRRRPHSLRLWRADSNGRPRCTRACGCSRHRSGGSRISDRPVARGSHSGLSCPAPTTTTRQTHPISPVARTSASSHTHAVPSANPACCRSSPPGARRPTGRAALTRWSRRAAPRSAVP